MDGLTSNAQVLFAQGLMREHKWGEAAQVYQSLLVNYPGNVYLVQELATALVFQGRRLEGVSLLLDLSGKASKASKYNESLTKELERKLGVLSRTFLTNQSFERYQEAVNLLESKKFAQAESGFLKVLQAEPHHLEAVLKIAQCLIWQGKYDEAIEYLGQKKAWASFAPEISQWLGRALFLKASSPQSAQKAVVELRAALSKTQGSQELVVWLAQAYVSAGQTQYALNLLDRDVQARPFHIVSLLTSAKIKAQIARGDLPLLWSARKDLQLALSRLGDEHSDEVVRVYELTQGERRKLEEIRIDFQKLLQQIQSLLEEQSARS